MKLTNADIFVAQEPLKELTKEKFPVKVSYGLAKLVSALQAQSIIIENVRNGLIQKYGTPSKSNPQNIEVLPTNENFPKFVEDFNTLMSEEVEIDVEKIKLPDKVDDKDLTISPATLVALDKFIDV